MKIRLPNSPLWLRITPDLALELKQQNNREELDRIKSTSRRPLLESTSNFTPRTTNGPFTVPQPIAGPSTRREESDEELHARINKRLMEEAGQKRGRRTWTPMEDIEPVEIPEEDTEADQPTPTRVRRTTGLKSPARKSGTSILNPAVGRPLELMNFASCRPFEAIQSLVLKSAKVTFISS